MDTERFGAFDGRFLGISLELSGAGERERLPWLSPAVREPAGAAPIISRLDPETALQGLLEATSLTHELRHFHDFMLSPLGSFVVSSRSIATANTIPLLFWFAREPGVVPVPLTRWITMPAAQRDAYWARASAFSTAAGWDLGPPLQVPFAPVLGSDLDDHGEEIDQGLFEGMVMRRYGGHELRFNLLNVAGQYARSEWMLGGVVMRDEQWNPAQLFEANALAVQLQHARLATNAEVGSALFNVLCEGSGVYSQVIERMSAFGRRGEGGEVIVSMGNVMALFTYALLGSYQRGNFYGQPMVRFGVIGTHLIKHGSSEAATVRELYEEWDRLLAEEGLLTMPLFEGLEVSLETDAQLAAYLDREISSRAESDLALAVKVSCREFLAARRELCARFLEDPDAYVHPTSYLELVPDLPRPAVCVSCGPEDREAAVRLVEAEGWGPVVRATESQVIAQPPHDFLPGEGAFHLEALNTANAQLMAGEAIFLDNPAVTEAGARVLREIFEDRISLLRVTLPRQGPPSSLGEGGSRWATNAD